MINPKQKLNQNMNKNYFKLLFCTIFSILIGLIFISIFLSPNAPYDSRLTIGQNWIIARMVETGLILVFSFCVIMIGGLAKFLSKKSIKEYTKKSLIILTAIFIVLITFFVISVFFLRFPIL